MEVAALPREVLTEHRREAVVGSSGKEGVQVPPVCRSMVPRMAVVGELLFVHPCSVAGLQGLGLHLRHAQVALLRQETMWFCQRKSVVRVEGAVAVFLLLEWVACFPRRLQL